MPNANPCPQDERAQEEAYAQVNSTLYYHPTVVASLVTTFFRNATETGTELNDIEKRLESAIDMVSRSTNPAAQLYMKNICAVLRFYQAGNNKKLFEDVLVPLRALLSEISKPGNRWSPCLCVSQATIKDIYKLPKP
jgi:hypothetical protein